MKRLSLLVCVVLAVIIGTVYAEDQAQEEPAYIEGHPNNFDNTLRLHEYVFVKFYAPWCGHCQKMEPDFKAAATELRGKVTFVKLDASKYTDIAARFDVSGFPTLKLFRKGEVVADYDAERTVSAMVKWLSRKAGPSYSVIDSLEGLAMLKNNDEYVSALVAFLEEGSEEYKGFLEFSSEPAYGSFAFGVITDAALIKEVGGELNTAKLYKDDTEHVVSSLSETTLGPWLLANGYPVLENLKLDAAFVARITNAKRPLAVAFTDRASQSDSQVESSIATFKRLAEKFQDRIHFTKTDLASYPNVPESWGGSGVVFPTLFLILLDKENPEFRAWDEDKPFEYEAVEAWLEGCASGDACPTYIRSEPIPESNDGPVKTVVGFNFESIVNDAEADVFVDFYAHWCPHCKKLDPAWTRVAERFVGTDVVLAKMESTKNTVPSNIEITGYPTLLFFPKGAKDSPIKFDSVARDVEALTDWVLEHSTSKHTRESLNIPPAAEAPSDEL